MAAPPKVKLIRSLLTPVPLIITGVPAGPVVGVIVKVMAAFTGTLKNIDITTTNNEIIAPVLNSLGIILVHPSLRLAAPRPV